MGIVIRRLTDANSAYEIAKSLPDYFNDSGLRNIFTAVKNEILFMAFDKESAI